MSRPTAKEARREARAILRHGHFQPSATELYARCRGCRSDVAATVFAWANERQRDQALEDALTTHLTDNCETNGTP